MRWYLSLRLNKAILEVPNRGGSVTEGASAELGGASGNGKKLLA